MLFISNVQKEKLENYGLTIKLSEKLAESAVCTKDGIVQIKSGNQVLSQQSVVDLIRHENIGKYLPHSNRVTVQEKQFLLGD